jgi:hypothetical protein
VGASVAAAEAAISNRLDDRARVKAFVRLRAELGNPSTPTRLVMFPPSSTLSRVDATGLIDNDPNAVRSHLAAARGASSRVLVDDGPRRWLIGVSRDDTRRSGAWRNSPNARIRPWAIERVSNLPPHAPPTIGSTKRFVARLLPRRH